MESSTPDELVAQFMAIISLLNSPLYDLQAVAIGLPGPCCDGVLIAAANILPNHDKVPISDMLSPLLSNIPVVLLNDADAALFAQISVQRPLLAHVKNMCMLTLGTGVINL